MLAISVRDRPCSDFDSRSSSGRTTAIVPSSARLTVIGSATTWRRVPLGPFTVTFWPSMVMSTPDGTGTGSFPIRLMVVVLSPDVGENFSAYSALGCLTVGEQAVGRRDDRDAQAAEDAGHAGGLRVDAQAGLGHPPHAGDAALAVRAVLEVDGQHAADLALGSIGDLEAGDVTLLLEDLGDVPLELGVRHLDGVVERRVGVADTGEHVRDGVGHCHEWAPAVSIAGSASDRGAERR